MRSAAFIGADYGQANVGFGTTPWEMLVSNAVGSRLPQMELVQLAERQPLEIRTVPFPLELAPMASDAARAQDLSLIHI